MFVVDGDVDDIDNVDDVDDCQMLCLFVRQKLLLLFVKMMLTVFLILIFWCLIFSDLLFSFDILNDF